MLLDEYYSLWRILVHDNELSEELKIKSVNVTNEYLRKIPCGIPKKLLIMACVYAIKYNSPTLKAAYSTFYNIKEFMKKIRKY